MPAHKRNEAQRQLDIPEIQALAIRGYSHEEIATKISAQRDYTLSRQQITYDMQDVNKMFEALAAQQILLQKGREIAAANALEHEAWKAWDRSQQDKVVKTTNVTMRGETILNQQINERIETQVGDKGFLDAAAASSKARRDMWGLDAPKQSEVIELAPLAPAAEKQKLLIPASIISKDFVDVLRDVEHQLHTEYLLYGGRGSTKSSFISLMIIALIVNNPNTHALAIRQVANTLRDSVFAQLQWAIDELGLTADFKTTTSPIEITYRPTGQKIFCRGADEPGKLKSLKPAFGAISILWIEELDQLHGLEAVRKIEQSVVRGAEQAWVFKSFNPPRTVNSWVNQYVLVPKKNQLQSFSNYLSVPRQWLGQPWLDEAEHLQQINPEAYKHEYGGIAVGLGGMVFENVISREITDAEIKQFDHVGQGLDFGWFPDPLAWHRSHYDAARRRLFIFDEYRANKKSNQAVYNHLVKEKHIDKYRNELTIGDSAEPKSVADFRSYGMNIRGAEKQAESVDYGIKWLQSLTEIVIDPKRCPEHLKEFYSYELEQDKDGNYISEYPDKNNHFIDATRYRVNLTYRVRGQ